MIPEHFKQNLFLYISAFVILVLYLLNIDNGFFGDTVQLGSQHANYYYTNNFSSLLLPDSIDSGHIPTFGMYLGLVWKIFGRSLIISHLAMLPFVIGIVWQLNRVIKYYFNKEQSSLIVLLVLLDPSLLSQTTLISPDIPLVFFFLLGWNSIIQNKKPILLVSVFFLFLTSMRGMMVSFCLLIIDLFYNVNFKDTFKIILKSLLKRSTIYLPSLLLFISFSIYHYIEKDWIGFHDESPWAGCFERVDIKGFLLNLVVLGWRIVDFGRIGIWLVFSILLIKYRKNIFKDEQTRALFFIFICFLVFLPLNMLWGKNLLGHRYLIPVYLAFSILVAKILFSSYTDLRLKRILIFVWLFALLSGNLWVYPDKISQGWDSTLGHLPYYELRKQAIKYIDEQDIGINNVHSFFPNTAKIDDIDLNGDFRRFPNYCAGAEYVLYSNIYNIVDEDYDTLIAEYDLIKEFKKSTVYVRLYKRKI
jgi:hypothetical protein